MDLFNCFSDSEPITDYFSSHKKWMIFIGIWPPITCENRFVRYLLIGLHRFFQVFLCLLNLHVAVMFYVTFVREMGKASFARVSYTLSQAIIFSFSTFCVFYMQLRGEACQQMMSFMNEHFKYRSSAGLTYVTARKSFKVSSFLACSFVSISELSVFQWVIYPFFDQERTLPLLCWYPFDQLASPMYEIIFVLHGIAQFELAHIFCTSSSFFLSASIMICGQYDVLFCSLKNMLWTAKMRNGGYTAELRLRREKIDLLRENKNGRYYISEEKLDQLKNFVCDSVLKRKQFGPKDTYQMKLVHELDATLHDCIQHHQKIVECCKQLENISSPWSLVKCIQISFQICLLSLTFIKSTGSIVDVVNTAQYLALTLADLFLISYMGQIVQSQSVRVRDFLFETPWYRFNATIRRSMIITLMYTMRPRLLTGGKFFVMGYDKCVGIMKLSFSYFTLLNNIGST